MKKWRCMICDYIHVGPEPPSACRECGVSRENFEEVVDSCTLGPTPAH